MLSKIHVAYPRWGLDIMVKRLFSIFTHYMSFNMQAG